MVFTVVRFNPEWRMDVRIECKTPEAAVKRAFWLAWQACGGTMGAGFLQNNPNAGEDDVWNQASNRGDYPGGNAFGSNKPGNVYGDYVFGRMMKLGLKWDETGIEFTDSAPRSDYQAWCRKYPTYQALIEAAVGELAKS